MGRRIGLAVIALTLVGLGWIAGWAQSSSPPDFELRVDAPGGETIIECVRGCNLAWVERGIPSTGQMSTFRYSCTGGRCSSGRVGGWLAPR